MAYQDGTRQRAATRGATIGLLAVALGMGCGNVVVEETTGEGGGGSTSTSTPSTTSTAQTGGGGQGGNPVGGFGGTGGEGGTTGCVAPADADLDGDGYSILEGDCNDCNPNINPGAAEIVQLDGEPPPAPQDEDCDGIIDEVTTCDEAVALDATDPLAAVRAIELCSFVSDGATHGVVSAAWKLPDGTEPSAAQMAKYHMGHGVLPDLGPHAKPKRGSRFLALATGTARRPSDPGYQIYYNKGYTSGAPEGLPINTPGCPPTGTLHDGISLDVEILAPSNAVGFRFEHRFYTGGWPKDVCTSYNDQFVTLMLPPPAGVIAGNVVHDKLGFPFTIDLFTPDACTCDGISCANEVPPCFANAADLGGTGFETSSYGAMTYWSTAYVPVEKGQTFTLRFMVYDGGDFMVDTTALIDAFGWLGP